MLTDREGMPRRVSCSSVPDPGSINRVPATIQCSTAKAARIGSHDVHTPRHVTAGSSTAHDLCTCQLPAAVQLVRGAVTLDSYGSRLSTSRTGRVRADAWPAAGPRGRDTLEHQRFLCQSAAVRPLADRTARSPPGVLAHIICLPVGDPPGPPATLAWEWCPW